MELGYALGGDGVQVFIYMKSLNTTWTNRTRKLKLKYLQTIDGGEQNTTVQEGIKETEGKMWKERMLTKLALTLDRSHKQEIKKEIYI